MKNLLSITSLLALLVFGGCKKDDEANPEPVADIDLGVFKLVQDPATGKNVRTPINCTIWMWGSDNREFDIAASGPEIYVGRILDKKTQAFVSAEYGAIGVQMTEKIKPGKYLVYVVINKSDLPGSQAYSYKYVEVGDDKKLSFKKVFSANVGTGQYEEWDKNQ